MARIAYISVVAILGLALLTCCGLVLAGIAGPTVLFQQGIREAEGIGMLSPKSFHSLQNNIWPRVSSRPTDWFWGRTAAASGEFIVAFDSRVVAIAKSNGSVLKSWLVLPTAVPLLALVGLLGAAISPRVLKNVKKLGSNRKGLCAYCQYDLAGNILGKCPECGNAIPQEHTTNIPLT